MVKKFGYPYPPCGEDRVIHLYLPDDYAQTEERYPVLYFFDGHNLFFDGEATFGKCLGMKEFLDNWHKKTIVVGIACSSDELTRVHEYMPFDVQTDLYGHIAGRGEETLSWIVHDLKPFIDANYRTIPFRECTAIGGYSLGGLMALYAGLRYNRYFSKAAAISPTVLPAMEEIKAEIARDELSPDTRIFFSWGTNEASPDEVYHLSRSVLYLEKRVQEKGARTYICCQQGGLHNEGSWRYAVPEMMNFLFIW